YRRPQPPRPRLFPYTTLFRSPSDRLAERSTTDTELLRERDLRELGARLQATREDLLTEMVVDPLPQSQILEAGRTASSRRSRSRDRKSTRLNSSHVAISYAVF